jgi:hypothetical protein
MSSSDEGPLLILRKWDEEMPWVYVAATFGEFEKHELWARVVEVSDHEVLFVGKLATVSGLVQRTFTSRSKEIMPMPV